MKCSCKLVSPTIPAYKKSHNNHSCLQQLSLVHVLPAQQIVCPQPPPGTVLGEEEIETNISHFLSRDYKCSSESYPVAIVSQI